MTGIITGSTGVYGIIGYPIGHSLSPMMQNAAFEQLGLDCIFVPFAVHPDGLGQAVEGLRSLGVVGFNVTVPHKAAIIPFLDEISPEALLAGAVNTVKLNDGRLIGYNTDGIGLLASLRDDLGFVPEGKTVLILGAGGAAMGGAAALCNAAVSEVFIANRTIGRAKALASKLSGVFPHITVSAIGLETGELAANASRADLCINTTSVGLGGGTLDYSFLQYMDKAAVVYDMVYNPPKTVFLTEAERCGMRIANGLGMLAAQGEAAFQIWTGMQSPSGLMKSRLAGFILHR